MGKETTSLGRIHISLNAIATIAYHATLESYGVVALTPKNLAQGLANSLTRVPTRGVSVNYENEELNIDIYIIVEYGTRISTVANNVVNTVRYHVEKALDLPVNNIKVHVAGLRFSDNDWLAIGAKDNKGLDSPHAQRRLATFSQTSVAVQSFKRLVERGLDWIGTK